MHSYSARRKVITQGVRCSTDRSKSVRYVAGKAWARQAAESYRCDAKLTESATYDANNIQSVKYDGNR